MIIADILNFFNWKGIMLLIIYIFEFKNGSKIGG